MNFNFNKNKNYNVVTFTNFNISKIAAKEKLFELFRRVGGDNPQYELEWIFPKIIYRHDIEEIIHNTCFVCGGLMKDGQAIQNDTLKMPGDRENNGYTPYPDTTNHSVINVRKCTSCGHSHT